jgi:ADP-ribose pyrophosphatase YjhB (NUDIX family)
MIATITKPPRPPVPGHEAVFCVRCAARLGVGTPDNDGRRRLLCESCDYIHYENPKVLVSCFVSAGTGVLLCRRAIEPAKGRWSLPGGFLENGETLEQAAVREIIEETGVSVRPQELVFYGATTLTSLGQVYVNFRVTVVTTHCEMSREALQVGFFRESEVPWKEIAYPAIAASLRVFFIELRRNRFGVHIASDRMA